MRCFRLALSLIAAGIGVLLPAPAQSDRQAISQKQIVSDLIDAIRHEKFKSTKWGAVWGGSLDSSWAATRLFAIGKPAVPTLTQQLGGLDIDIARAAATGLRIIGTRAARDALEKQTQNPDVHIRWEVFLAFCDPDTRPEDPPKRKYTEWDPSTWFRPDERVGS